MGTVDLSIHITGPTWAWWALGGAVAVLLVLGCVKTALEIYVAHLKRKKFF